MCLSLSFQFKEVILNKMQLIQKKKKRQLNNVSVLSIQGSDSKLREKNKQKNGFSLKSKGQVSVLSIQGSDSKLMGVIYIPLMIFQSLCPFNSRK